MSLIAQLRQRSFRRVPCRRERHLFQGLQFFARLESHSLARGDGNFGTCARIATDSRLAGTHVENPKASQFDALAMGQCTLHAFKNSLHRHFCFGFGNACSVDYFIDDVEFDQNRPPNETPPTLPNEDIPNPMIRLGLKPCQERRFPVNPSVAPAPASQPV